MTATSSRKGTRRRRKSRPRPTSRPALEAELLPPPPPDPSASGASSSSAADAGAAADVPQPGELEDAAQILGQRTTAEAVAAAEGAAELEAPPTPGAPVPGGADPAELGARIHMVAFTLVAARLGDHWELTPQEQKIAGETIAPLLAALMARVSGIAINLTMYSVVLLSLVVPRLKRDAELERERDIKKHHKEGGADGGETEPA